MDLLLHLLQQTEQSRATTECRLSRIPVQALLLFLLLIGVSLSRAAAADILADLNSEQQLQVTRVCTPVQFSQGTSAYRQCVLNEIATAVQNQQTQTTALSALSLDEQFAIQQVCDSTRSDSPAKVRRCTQLQIEQLRQEPEPELSVLFKDEQYIITTQCLDSFSATAARDFRVCVNDAVNSLDTLPEADFAGESTATRSKLQLECSIKATDVNDYRKCLLSALDITYTDSPVADTTPTENTLEQAEVSNTVPQERADAGNATQSIEAQDADQPEPPAEPTAAVPDTESTARADQLSPVEVSTKPAELTKYVAIVLAVCSLLILLLIGFTRRSGKHKRHAATAKRTNSDEMEIPGPHRSPARPDLRPVSAVSQLSGNTGLAEIDSAIEADVRAVFEQPVANSKPQIPKSGNQKTVKPNHTSDVPSVPAPTPDNSADHEQFAAWLTHWPRQRQQEHAIELLIYWMAYADNRYDPVPKETSGLTKNPDPSSLIKRWVFKNDVAAFADAVKHLQHSTDLEQRKQIIDVLMALLVNERALTPNQNVLLRFLADAFGIGSAGIDIQFRHSFGQSMPALPRPDKTVWWKSRDAGQKLRWDTHAIARQPEQIRCRIVLGQPLGGALDLQSINKSYTMAINRCHHKRASRLGERERMLLSMQRQKFVLAHQTLLESVE